MKKLIVVAMVLLAAVMYFLLTIDYYAWGKSALTRGEAEKAFVYFSKAANQGNVKAMFSAADMLEKGNGTPQDLPRAAELFRQASEARHPCALYRYGSLLMTGKGVAKDARQAAKLFMQAAELGSPEAQFEMGLMHAEGRHGYDRDYRKSVEWYRKAAEMGHGSAQFNLASMYQFGQGVDPDPVEAYIWYSLAANFGRTDAAQIRDYVIAKRITQDQINKSHETAQSRLAEIEARKAVFNQ